MRDRIAREAERFPKIGENKFFNILRGGGKKKRIIIVTRQTQPKKNN